FRRRGHPMSDIQDRCEALLHAPLGCAFLLVASSSHLPPEVATEPAVSLRIAARALHELSVWRADPTTVMGEVLRRGRQYTDLAQRILEQPGAAWWFGPLDRAEQLWVSRSGDPLDAQRV